LEKGTPSADEEQGRKGKGRNDECEMKEHLLSIHHSAFRIPHRFCVILGENSPAFFVCV
jgi:hypothetical protein